jgi:hypothetical protein
VVHIDSSLLRVIVDSAVIPEDLIVEPSSSVHANLRGVFEPWVYPRSAEKLLDAILSATVIAHEQRHYVDYYLTNYGSWLYRFWAQSKQFLPELLDHGGPLLIPLRYFANPVMRKNFGVDFPDSGELRSAVTLAVNHSRFVGWDRVPEMKRFGGLSGHAQLEALATVFELGPIENTLDPRSWLAASLALPRDLATWRRSYVWPAEIFAHFDIGSPPTEIAGGIGHITDSSLWPAFLVASLMGNFDDLRPTKVADDPDLPDRILPSRRFMAIMGWLIQRSVKPSSPKDAWEAVNEACASLFGRTVTESMAQEIDALEARAKLQMPSAGERVLWSLGALELLAHLRQRRRVLTLLENDPMKYIDPAEYWMMPPGDVRLIPEYILVNRNGFQSILDGHKPFESPMYQVGVEGRHVFLKPIQSSNGDFETQDETLTTVMRLLLGGYTSSAWIGPELEKLVTDLGSGPRPVHVIPPYNQLAKSQPVLRC